MTQSKVTLKFKPISLSTLSKLRRIFIQHNEQWIFTPANEQDLQNYTLLHEHLASLIGHHDLNSVFDTIFFDGVVKRVTRNKNLIFALRSTSILSLTSALTLYGFTFGAQSLPIGVTVFMLAIVGALSARTLSDLILRSTGCLIEDIISNAKEPKLAKKVIHELETKIFGKYEFYFIDQNGVLNQLPKNLYLADNSLVFFLGKPEHREAVPLSGYPPRQDLYISKRKPTKDSRSPNVVKQFLNNKIVISDLLKTIKEHHPFDPAKPKEKLSVTRTSWVNALQIIDDNWSQWQKLLLRTGSNTELQNKLIESLQIRGKTEKQMIDIFNEFTTGGNRNFRNWLTQLGFIDSDTHSILNK